MLDTCATMDIPSVFHTRYKECERINCLFPVNSEMSTENKANEILSLIDVGVKTKLIDCFIKQMYTPVG